MSWKAGKLIMIAVGIAISGCSSSPPAKTKKAAEPPFDPSTADMRFRIDKPLPTTARAESRISTAVTDTPVAVGSLPLVYLVGSAGTARIADLDTKQDLSTAAVGHNSTVAVDAHRGVIVDGHIVHAGPLAAGDRYGIFYAAQGSTDGAYITATESNDPSITRWRNPATRKDSGDANSAAQPTTRP